MTFSPQANSNKASLLFSMRISIMWPPVEFSACQEQPCSTVVLKRPLLLAVDRQYASERQQLHSQHTPISYQLLQTSFV